MSTDTKVKTLIINKGTLDNLPTNRDPKQMYVATDAPAPLDAVAHDDTMTGNGTADSPLSVVKTGASLPLLVKLISNHMFNDVSYLNANTFSWQSGAVYVAVYQHLVDDLSTAGAVQTATIDGVTISYEVATDGHRICLPTQETAISQLYAKTGEADFYILDTENARFKLPRTQKRKLIRAVKNADGSWYNLYSDSWVEQGGQVVSSSLAVIPVTLPIKMADTNYAPHASLNNNTVEGSGGSFCGVHIVSTTSINITQDYITTNTMLGTYWSVEGYADSSVLANEPVQYEYYYVGNFEQSAIEQTAGLNAEQFNAKADVDLANVLANIDFVVESQLPTEENSYTWYRKYKSGWVEQGGITQGGTGVITVSLPVAMADTAYSVLRTQIGSSTQSYYPAWVAGYDTKTTTSFTCQSATPTNQWEVKGYAA